MLIASIAYAQKATNDGFVVKSTADAITHFVPTQREGKNLVGTFPFNQQRSHHDAHHEEHDHHDEHRHDEDHGDHAVHSENLSAREARQRNRNRNRGNNRGQQRHHENEDGTHGSGNGVPTFDEVSAAGERCIDKVEMVEHTEYDEQVVCKHSYSEQCHQTYVTDYKPAQKQECEDNFVKNCHIEYKKSAQQETVRKCSQPLTCGGEGPKVCRNIHTTVCETKLEIHNVNDDVVDCKTVIEEDCKDITQGYSTTRECKKWPKVECTKTNVPVTKTSPITECSTRPTEVCGPEGCILEQGDEFCVDEVQTVINPVSFLFNLSTPNSETL